MQIISATFFPGPNQHVLRSALEAIVDLGLYAEAKSTDRPGFVQSLTTAFPGLTEHHCSRGHRGGFVERLAEGTYFGHIVEHVALECLYMAGERGTYGQTRQRAPRHVRLVFESETEAGGLSALRMALKTVQGLWDCPDSILDPADLARFCQELNQYRLGPSTRAIVDAARRRDIPVWRLDDANLVLLGQGINQHRIRGSLSDQTSIVGADAAQDKELTARLLSNAGIPVPRRCLVETEDEAIKALERMHSPVVIKPIDGSHGRGVVMNIRTPEHMKAAVAALREVSPRPFIVEEQIPGRVLRLLVVAGEMVAAAERRVPTVMGDGRRTVRELLDDLNRDPRRGPDHGFPMSWAVWDADAAQTLREQGWDLQSVLPKGTCAPLRRTANMSTGASARDVTADICPALTRDAVRAAQALGLDIAGVDIVTPRLDCRLEEAGGGVIEVNASPGLRMHLYPAEGVAQPVGDRIIQYLFGGSNGRIPVAAITGTNGKTTVTRMLGHIASQTGMRVGMATTDGITIGSETVKQGDLTGPWSARLVLNDPTVQMAVLETARGGMVRGGLGFDDADVGIVTNIGQDHLGQDGIETLEDLIHLKSLIVDVIRPGGKAVLNADDDYVLSFKDRARCDVVLFSTQSNNQHVRQHLADGGAAVFVHRGYLYFGHNGLVKRLIGTRVLPASLGGLAAINVANAAAAAAAALALGFSPRQVSDGLLSFPRGGAGLNRGRLEMLQGQDVRVLVDYGHNVPAITALEDICRRLKPQAVVTVLGLPGDRRDDDIRQSARVVAQFSQRIVIREDADRRGRLPGAMAEMMRHTVLSEGVQDVRVVLDEEEAVREAVLTADPGSLVLVLYERYHRVRQAAEAALAEREAVFASVDQALAQA